MLSVRSQGSFLAFGRAATGSDGGFVLPRFLRRPARAFAHLFSGEVAAPRFAGGALSCALLAATGLYGAVLGGHMPAVIEAVTASSGFAVNTVDVTGNKETSEIDVLGAIGLNGYTSLIGFDAQEARARIAGLPWVASATVRKTYPATVQVEIEERKPFAIWQHGEELTIIDSAGRPIVAYGGVGHADLPLVVGEGGAERASAFIAQVAGYPELARHVIGYMRIADRRWDLRLDNGVTVQLPERDETGALDELARLDREQGLLRRDIVAVDMRLSDRIAIRLAPDIAEARQAALKERMKAAKERRT